MGFLYFKWALRSFERDSTCRCVQVLFQVSVQVCRCSSKMSYGAAWWFCYLWACAAAEVYNLYAYRQLGLYFVLSLDSLSYGVLTSHKSRFILWRQGTAVLLCFPKDFGEKVLLFWNSVHSAEVSEAYNPAWNNPAKYFTSPYDLDLKKLRPCSQTILVDTDIMSSYLRAVGDNDGVVIQGRATLDEVFWGFQKPSVCLAWDISSSTGPRIFWVREFSMTPAFLVAENLNSRGHPTFCSAQVSNFLWNGM